MGFELERLLTLRPWLYHLTSSTNVRLLRSSRRLVSAAQIFREAGRVEEVHLIRRGPRHVLWQDATVTVCDQDAFRPGHIRLQGGLTIADVLELLNRRVYFWPGDGDGPIKSGMNHFERYRGSKPSILRMPFDAPLKANPKALPELCAFNSGAPRTSQGQKTPRGNATFLKSTAFPRPPSSVIEVTFVGEMTLPETVEIGRSPTGPWRPL